jgi:hypothetical protein
MANTLIQLKNSGASGNTPGSLAPGELAINYADGKLYYGNALNNPILFDVITEPAGLNQEIQFNDAGVFGSSANLKFDSSTKTLTTDKIVSANVEVTSNLVAENVIAHTALYVGIADISHTPLANSLGYFTGNSSPYIQVNVENIDPAGSADWVATADVGSDATFYTDLGIQNSGSSDGTIKALDGYLLVQGNTGQIGGNLVIGTISGTPGQEIRVVVDGNEDANVVLKINSSGLQMLRGDITSNITTRISNVSNSAFAQANLAYNAANSAVTTGQANVGAGLIVVTGRTNSAFGQANLAYDAANAANSLAQAAYNYANTIITGGSSGDYFPIAPYGFVSQSMIALVSDDTFIQGELIGPIYDCSDNPITPEGFYLEKDLGYLT